MFCHPDRCRHLTTTPSSHHHHPLTTISTTTSLSPNEFEIVSNYPKRRLPCQPVPGEPDPPTLAASGFGKSEMLFVNDLES